MLKTVFTLRRQTDMSRIGNPVRRIEPETCSIGPMDVKKVDRKSSLPESNLSSTITCERITKSANAVKNGLKIVETIRARSRQTRRCFHRDDRLAGFYHARLLKRSRQALLR